MRLAHGNAEVMGTREGKEGVVENRIWLALTSLLCSFQANMLGSANRFKLH